MFCTRQGPDPRGLVPTPRGPQEADVTVVLGPVIGYIPSISGLPPLSPPPLPGLASWWCPPVPQAEHSGGLGPCLSQVSLLSLPPCSVAPQGHHNHLHKASSLGSPLPTLWLPNFQRLPDFCLNKVPSQGGPAPTRPSVCSSALPACPPATYLTLSCSLLSSAWVPAPRKTQVPRPLPET